MNPQLDNIIREVRDLVAGRSNTAEVTRRSDPGTRQVVAEQLLAAMSGPDAAEQERARKIFISHGYLDETTNKFRTANAAVDRAAAAHTLGIVGSHLATAHLVAGVFDSAPEVCHAAAEALARIADPAVATNYLNLLFGSKSEQSATDRSRVESRIAESSQLETEPGRSVEPERSVDVHPLVNESDVADVPREILTGLNSSLPQERVAALDKLTRSGAKAAFRLIANFFNDDSADVRNAAARALYELDPPRCAESFGRAIEESSPDPRGNIARNIGAALAASGLAGRALEDLAGDSREAAYNSLCLLFAMAKTGEVQPLIQAIEQHQSAEVRRAAVKLLTLNGQPEVAAAAAKRRLMMPRK